MEVILTTILSYFVGLAANLRTDAILARREEKLKEQLEKEDALRKALASTRPIREELGAACAALARNRHRLGVTPQEEPLWRLLSDDAFQADLVEWLMAGGIVEGKAVKDRLVRTMEVALADGGASQEQIGFLKASYFEALDKAMFAHPILAHWRHQLSLDYLREQVAVLRRRAEEAAGIYSPEKQKAALDRYCEKALAAWDIIDLSNLPEGDIDIATQKLLLRQLYMPLRIEVAPTKRDEGDDAVLAKLEEQREIRRHREAGHRSVDEPDRPDRTESRSPVGERLGVSRRLVVLGDPGGGKTTMLRWLATAYLLRLQGDDALTQIPDTQTLPSQSWIPVLIRCRDLGEADLCRCFTDFLTQHINKTELLPEEADVMRAVILNRIAKGEALLLVDGLDEITNPHVRMMFCQELERTAARYPNAPIVITSRIVGYRDMPYRMGSSFEHGVIAELNRNDKDLFAQRWVEVTEQHHTPAEKTKRTQELLDALHSSDRIERLTGNPMLLTTLALVKRKVGKLPNRRNKLYAEAVSVLLNWNPRLYEAIEEDEAIPQLEYLAYEMCRRGVQRLTDDEVLELLEKLRLEYPNIRAIRRRKPQAFLALLEARSSILIKSGGVWQKSRRQEKPVWEFRHLTFQEYLAARALLDGRYPGRDKTKSLAEQVAPLAGKVELTKRRHLRPDAEPEVEVPESWREALRLLVAECKDDDVDEVLLAMLNPTSGEDVAKTARPRTVLATLCLTDEPNTSEDTALQILDHFVAHVRKDDSGGHIRTSLSAAGVELGKCIWAGLVKQGLMKEYLQRPPSERHKFGSLWAMIEAQGAPDAIVAFEAWFVSLITRLRAEDEIERTSAALVVMEVAFLDKARMAPGLIEALLALLPSDPPARLAAAWALGRLCIDVPTKWNGEEPIWRPQGTQVRTLMEILHSTDPKESDTVRWLVHTLGFSRDPGVIQEVIQRLIHDDPRVRKAAIEALGQLGDKRAVEPLLAKLNDLDADVRKAAIEALGQLGGKRAVEPLLAKLNDLDADVRRVVARALGRLGDKRAVEPLIHLLEDRNLRVCVAAAGVLTVLGADRGSSALRHFLDHGSLKIREAAVGELLRMRGKKHERVLLSRDLDGIAPWMDPSEPITETRLAAAAQRLGITTQKVRSLYESIAADFHLRFEGDSSVGGP